MRGWVRVGLWSVVAGALAGTAAIAIMWKLAGDRDSPGMSMEDYGRGLLAGGIIGLCVLLSTGAIAYLVTARDAPESRDSPLPRSVMVLASIVLALSLLAAGVFVTPLAWAARFRGGEDACMMSGHPYREGMSVLQSWSWWPLGFRCEWHTRTGRTSVTYVP